ncbi:hypothetical protein EZS27_034123 [termite gut metagenome]|uniref:Transposase IS4-like domain-containing protein n=1 Tax=termite gut metagenome TaxID=433724 RepID=A0A5J4Q423_9ZZZZ
MPEDKDSRILKNEIIHLRGKLPKTQVSTKWNSGVLQFTLKQGNRTVELITNNSEWEADTIAELYKRRWLIETFFKLLRQNLQIKTFLDTTENTRKSQLFIDLICYLLFELIRRTMSKVSHRFGHFLTFVRVCLIQYNRFGYIVNIIKIEVRRARKKANTIPNLFGNRETEKDFCGDAESMLFVYTYP